MSIDVIGIANLKDFSIQQLKEFANRNVPMVLFGAGGGCSPALEMMKSYGVFVIGIADNNKQRWGQSLGGLRIEELDFFLKSHPNLEIFISAPNNAHLILPELVNKYSGVKIHFFDKPNRIAKSKYRDYLIEHKDAFEKIFHEFKDQKSKETLIAMLSAWQSGDFSYFQMVYESNQYFNSSVISLSETECFLDVGAFDGDTIEAFSQAVGAKYKRIVALEPNPQFREVLEKRAREDSRIEAIFYGAYSRPGRFEFAISEVATQSQFSLIESDDGVPVDCIDQLVQGEITLVKMDIEGLEQEALKGAKEIILKNKPKLAICVYHRIDDLLKIFQWIDSLGIEYSYRLRHHTFYSGETVLYAIPKSSEEVSQ